MYPSPYSTLCACLSGCSQVNLPVTTCVHWWWKNLKIWYTVDYYSTIKKKSDILPSVTDEWTSKGTHNRSPMTTRPDLAVWLRFISASRSWLFKQMDKVQAEEYPREFTGSGKLVWLSCKSGGEHFLPMLIHHTDLIKYHTKWDAKEISL